MKETLSCPISQNRPNTEKWAQVKEVIIAMMQNAFAGNDPATEEKNGKAMMDDIIGG